MDPFRLLWKEHSSWYLFLFFFFAFSLLSSSSSSSVAQNWKKKKANRQNSEVVYESCVRWEEGEVTNLSTQTLFFFFFCDDFSRGGMWIFLRGQRKEERWVAWRKVICWSAALFFFFFSLFLFSFSLVFHVRVDRISRQLSRVTEQRLSRSASRV